VLLLCCWPEFVPTHSLHGAVQPERIAEQLALFDYELDAAELAAIDAVNHSGL
jgi:diketogulonate reductase-like aldo/keto reductase